MARQKFRQRYCMLADRETFCHLDASSLRWDRNIVAGKTKTPFPALLETRVLAFLKRPF
jgi:hypothetical protein